MFCAGKRDSDVADFLWGRGAYGWRQRDGDEHDDVARRSESLEGKDMDRKFLARKTLWMTGLL